MNPWTNMARLTVAQAQRFNVAALHFDSARAVRVGNKRFVLQFEPCLAGYPLRLIGTAANQPLTLDVDAAALFTELAPATLAHAGQAAPALLMQAFEDWLGALEGVFGFVFTLSRVEFEPAPDADRYGIALTHLDNGRTAHFAIRCAALDQWLSLCAPPDADTAGLALAQQIMVGVPVCLAGPALPLARLRKLRAGDALLLDKDVYFLRVPLRAGARRLLLTLHGDKVMVDKSLIDDARTPELTSEFIPVDALTFAFDAMLGTLSLSLQELSRLRTGSIVSLQLPVRERAVTLLCQGVPFARGELIDVEDALAVRITSLTRRNRQGAAT